jgi:hypothetical protein
MTTKARKTADEMGVKTAQEALEAMMAAGRETMETVLKAGVDAATDSYEKAVAFGKGQMETTADGYKKAAAFGKENFETFSAVAGALTAGFEAYSAELAKVARTATEHNVAYINKALTARTPQDFATLHTETVTRSVDAALAGTVELNKIAADTMVRCAGPVKARIDTAVVDFARPFAAP